MRVVARIGGSFLVVTGRVAKVRPDRDLGDLHLPARRYDPRLDWLSDEYRLGSFLKFAGGYVEPPNLTREEERRVVARVVGVALDRDGGHVLAHVRRKVVRHRQRHGEEEHCRLHEVASDRRLHPLTHSARSPRIAPR